VVSPQDKLVGETDRPLTFPFSLLPCSVKTLWRLTS
jgi:hypothetical protein